MQFRTLSVAVVVLAVVVVVMAADPPSADVLHAKCYHNGDKHWHIAGEQLDEEAMKTVPREYQAMGWKKWKSGKCSYKSGHADCPSKWWGDEHHWDRHYGYKKLYHACDDGHDCCSKTCLTVRNTTTPLKVCCPYGDLAFNMTATDLTEATAFKCCSNKVYIDAANVVRCASK